MFIGGQWSRSRDTYHFLKSNNQFVQFSPLVCTLEGLRDECTIHGTGPTLETMTRISGSRAPMNINKVYLEASTFVSTIMKK